MLSAVSLKCRFFPDVFTYTEQIQSFCPFGLQLALMLLGPKKQRSRRTSRQSSALWSGLPRLSRHLTVRLPSLVWQLQRLSLLSTKLADTVVCAGDSVSV